MRPDDRHDDQGSDDTGRPRSDIAGTGSAPQSREEEAHDTRAGRPMPEEDAANRTEHHKGSYGGEHGEPRDKPEEPDKPDKPGKGATGAE